MHMHTILAGQLENKETSGNGKRERQAGSQEWRTCYVYDHTMTKQGV